MAAPGVQRRANGFLLAILLSGTALEAAAAEVAPITVAQLPNDPVTACSNPAVRTAFAACRIGGPSARCCSGLDEVFANATSPAAWCLCIPQVLYKSVAIASDAGLDVLGILHKCRTGQPGFQTQWAAAHPTACPNITFSLNTAELVMQLGPDIVLASSKGRPKWAWANLLQFGHIMGEVPDINPIWNHIVGGRFANFMFLVIILMPPMFLAAHHGVLMPFSAAYQRLAAAERLIVCEHAVYVFVFSVSLIPQTVLALTSLFKAWTGWYLDSAQIAALLGVFIASRAILYAVEASVRSVVKWSWLLIVHHQLFFLIVLLALWGRNAAVAGLGVVLDLFACHEAPLYVALMSYRLQWPARFTQTVLRGAMVWYVLTRIFQSIILLYMIAGFATMPAVRSTPAFIVVSILCCVLTVIQAYTLVIYRAVDRKVAATLAAEAASGSKPSSSGSGGVPPLRLPLSAEEASHAYSSSPSSMQSNDCTLEVVGGLTPKGGQGSATSTPRSHAVRTSD